MSRANIRSAYDEAGLSISQYVDENVVGHDRFGSVANFCHTIAISGPFDSSDHYIQTSWGQHMISFKGSHFPKPVIPFAVYFYAQYSVSYPDLEEIMAKRGVVVDHATHNRWNIKYSPLIAVEAQRRKATTLLPWRMDEIYVKVRCIWVYLYRAIDKAEKTLDLMFSERRNE